MTTNHSPMSMSTPLNELPLKTSDTANSTELDDPTIQNVLKDFENVQCFPEHFFGKFGNGNVQNVLLEFCKISFEISKKSQKFLGQF